MLHRGNTGNAFEERVEVVLVGHNACRGRGKLSCRRWLEPRAGQRLLEEQPAGCSSTLEFEAVVSFPQRDRTETVGTETVGRVESETSL